ncbi:hypothetical protein [Bradyrhizobium nanningense]|uniref:hypothetical protein n=1 Tax=Bradyrhizobium nanningense TaxID=1325118 RepID=UPI003221E11D
MHQSFDRERLMQACPGGLDELAKLHSVEKHGGFVVGSAEQREERRDRREGHGTKNAAVKFSDIQKAYVGEIGSGRTRRS